MRRLLGVGLVVGAAALGFAVGVRKPDGVNTERAGVAIRQEDSVVSIAQPQPGRVIDPSAKSEFLRRIRESGTYLPTMIAESDSMLRRWPERVDQPLRVFLEPSDVEGVTAEKLRSVRDAFRRWERVPEIPVDFVYVDAPDRADVTVKWIRSFAMERAGQAEVLWQLDGWLRSGTLTLATHTQRGRPLSTDAVFTVALHEIGHLIGLGHSDDPNDVMYPTTGVHDLTRRDRQTAMFLYLIPPGSLKD